MSPEITLENRQLRIATAGLVRTWDVASLRSLSVYDPQRQKEWLGELPYEAGWRRSCLALGAPESVELQTVEDDQHGMSEPHWRADVRIQFPGVEVLWQHRIWADLPVVVSAHQWRVHGPVHPTPPEEMHDAGWCHLHPAAERLDFLALAPPCLRFEAVTFIAQTDYHDNPVQRVEGHSYPKETRRLAAHLLQLTDLADEAGLVVLKLAPSPGEQLAYPGYDLVCSGPSLAICGDGISEAELLGGESVAGYPCAVGVGEDVAELCYQLQRRRTKPRPRHFSIMCNTWGDGNRTSRICESMIADEIRTGAELGLTHVQLDAGWQRGDAAQIGVEQRHPRSPYALDPAFWSVHPERFPDGFAPLVALAAEHDIRLGFWFLPDPSDDYANWRCDAETVLALWREHGFDAVKIDGVSLHTKRGERRLLAFLKTIHCESNGALAVNFDITSGKARRLGLLYGGEWVTNYFLENRYLYNRSYYPHRTLRNLWLLSRYLPTYRLQIESPNVRLWPERYPEQPWSPQALGIGYALVFTLVANPLLWTELARLAPDDQHTVRRVLAAYRSEQELVLRGRVYPVGNEPVPRSWCGFLIRTDARSGFLFIMSDCVKQSNLNVCLSGFNLSGTVTLTSVIDGQERLDVELKPDGSMVVPMAPGQCYGWWRYRQ